MTPQPFGTRKLGDGSKKALLGLEAMDQQLGKLFAFVRSIRSREHPDHGLLGQWTEKGSGVAGPFHDSSPTCLRRAFIPCRAGTELMDGDSLGSVNRESVFSAIDWPTPARPCGCLLPPGHKLRWRSSRVLPEDPLREKNN